MPAKRKAGTITFADRVKPVSLNTGSVPAFAADLGFMSREGLSVKVLECDGTPQALAAMDKGDADLAQVNISPVVAEVAKGAALKVVWGSVHGNPLKPPPPSSAPSDGGVMLVTSPSIKTAEQLRGKRIGISQKGATNHRSVASYLRDHGIDPQSGVVWVEGGTVPSERISKVISGELDAAWTTSQTMALFEGKKGFRILAKGREVAEGSEVGYLVVVARAPLVKDEPQTVLSAVKGLVNAAREFSDHPEVWVDEAARRRPELPKDAIKRLWEQARGHWPVNGRLDPAWVKDTVAVLVKSGQVAKAPSLPTKDWVDMSFVDSALSELGKRPE